MVVPDCHSKRVFAGLVFSLLFIKSCSGQGNDQRSTAHKKSYENEEYFPSPGWHRDDRFVAEVLRLHVRYCGKNRVCRDYAPSRCYRCAPCQCDLNCNRYGDCCPDVELGRSDDAFPQPFTGRDPTVAHCHSAVVETSQLINSGKLSTEVTERLQSRREEYIEYHRYYMVSHCPNSFSAGEAECHSKLLSPPVTSVGLRNNSVVFKNIHCAHCHGVHNVAIWDVEISCAALQNLTSVTTTLDAIVKASLDPKCTAEYIPPKKSEARKCFADSGEMISSCNVTGLWPVYEEFLEKACHSYLTVKRVRGKLYKNVFCYLCNHNDDDDARELTSCQRNALHRSSTVMAVIRHNEAQESQFPLPGSDHKRCSQTEIYDMTEGLCRDVTCTLGQHMVSGGCRPLFLMARGLAYEIYFGLRATEPVDLSGEHDLLHHLPAEMEVYLGHTLLEGEVKFQDFAMAFNRTDSSGRCGQTASDLGVYARLVTEVLTDQGALQQSLLALRQSNFSIVTRAWNISFQAYASESPWHVMHPSRRHRPQALSTCFTVVANDHLERRRDGMMRVGTTTPDPLMKSHTAEAEPSFIRISSLIHCPQVRLLPHEYSVSNPGGELTLKFNDYEKKLGQGHFIMDLSGNVTVCFSDFLPKLRDRGRSRTEVEKTVAYIFLSISIICLLVTLMVFIVFSVLRSLPGKNNIVLIVCLLASHIALLIGYLVDDFSEFCAAFGILSHYFSLCVQCALVVFSYHVYTIFSTMHLSQNVLRENRAFMRYLSFIVALPCIIVLLVIVYYVVTSGNSVSFIGYGGNAICFPHSTTASWVSVFTPALVASVISGILFSLTFVNLRQNKDIEINTTDEKHVHFYFRLSLLTIVVWTVYAIAVTLVLPPLRIVFVALQCLVSVFVLVSLALTKRVRGLASSFCGKGNRTRKEVTAIKMDAVAQEPTKNTSVVVTGFRRKTRSTSDTDTDPIYGHGQIVTTEDVF